MNKPFSMAEITASDAGLSGETERRHRCPSPACAGKPGRSLAVNTAKGVYICHRCGAAGQLADPNGPTLGSCPPRRGQAGGSPTASPLRLAKSFHPAHLKLHRWQGTPAESYLASRGLTAPPAAGDIRYCAEFGPEHGPRRPAAVFAVRGGDRELVAVQGRFLDTGSLKAMTLGRLSLGLFATPGALDAPVIVVCEAPIDALALHSAGLPAVASCGSRGNWPDWFLLLITDRTVVAAHDADPAGDTQAESLNRAAGRSGRPVVRFRPGGGHHDWADVLATSFDQLVEEVNMLVKALGEWVHPLAG